MLNYIKLDNFSDKKDYEFNRVETDYPRENSTKYTEELYHRKENDRTILQNLSRTCKRRVWTLVSKGVPRYLRKVIVLPKISGVRPTIYTNKNKKKNGKDPEKPSVSLFTYIQKFSFYVVFK